MPALLRPQKLVTTRKSPESNYLSLEIPSEALWWNETRWRPAPPRLSEITLIELLKRTRTLLEGGWTQRAEAKDHQGNAVLPGLVMATAWCIRGALRAAAALLEPDLTLQQELFVRGYHHVAQVIRATGAPAVVEAWNDWPERTQSEVLLLMERAIQWVK